MIDTEEFQARIMRVQRAMTERMRLRGTTLEQQLRRAGRRLPRRPRRAGAIILGAQDWMAHPKLARVLDMGQVGRAFADLHAYLDTLDPHEIRRTARLRLAGGVVFNLVLLAGLIYVLIRWRGIL